MASAGLNLREVFINILAVVLVQIVVVAAKSVFPDLDPDILVLIAALLVVVVLFFLARLFGGGNITVIVVVVIVAAILVLVASFVVRDPSLKRNPSVPYEAAIFNQRLISVPADQYWFNTGVEVQKGDYVELEARGRWYSGISITGPKGDRGINALLGLRRCGQCPVVESA